MLPLPIRLALLIDIVLNLLPEGRSGALLAGGLIAHELHGLLRKLHRWWRRR